MAATLKTATLKTVRLNKAQIRTLDHCLRYGANAVSAIEHRNGTAAKRQKHIDQIRKQIS